jgi:hypothetical protein
VASGGEMREGVSLTNLDQPLFDGAGATKRDLVDYLDAAADLLIAELRDRPLSVIRVLRGRPPFMQKNVPKYTPPWVPTVSMWAESSRRQVSYAICSSDAYGPCHSQFFPLPPPWRPIPWLQNRQPPRCTLARAVGQSSKAQNSFIRHLFRRDLV